jgi:hypothetical protein
MKKSLLLLALFCFALTSSFSQITHNDYGEEGLVISLNENYSLDIDEDSFPDLYINQYVGELGFTPIFGIGCMASATFSEYTSFGAREMQIFAKDEEITINTTNMFDYIDDDRGSVYSSEAGLAEDWVANEEQYVAFAVFNLNNPDEVLNGWMAISVNPDNETLIIHELAYTEYASLIEPIIIKAGDTGAPVSINELDNSINEIRINPNPVYDQLNINFDYSGTENLTIAVLDNSGKLVEQRINQSTSQFSFDSSTWAAGIYFINLSSSQGTKTKKFVIQNQ